MNKLDPKELERVASGNLEARIVTNFARRRDSIGRTLSRKFEDMIIMITDADDYVHPDKIITLRSAFAEN